MAVYNVHQALFAKRHKTCKGRKATACRSSKKRCLWASGIKRSFCRKRNTRKNKRG